MIGLRDVWRIFYTSHSQICHKRSASRNAKYLKSIRGNERKQICYLTHDKKKVFVVMKENKFVI